MGSGADMDKDYLTLKRAAASRLSGEWSDDDYGVLAGGIVVGRIMKAAAAPVGQPWLWTLAYGHHEDRTPIYGYEPTREARRLQRSGGGSKPWQRNIPHGWYRLSARCLRLWASSAAHSLRECLAISAISTISTPR